MKLEWDKTSERLYETGVDKCALYVYDSSKQAYGNGVAWNGVTGITESPSGAEPSAIYADNIKYLTLMSAEDYGGTINAYMYPTEFGECDGSAELKPGVMIGQQKRKSFGLAYRTKIGNDTEFDSHGYKLHLVYGCLASVSERTYNTINESPDALELSWEYSCTPVVVDGFQPTAIVTIDSTKVDAEKLAALEKILYGDGDTEARLPLPNEVATIFAET